MRHNFRAMYGLDVIFIGSEIGLLAAAALLAGRGARVLVLEGRDRTVDEKSVLAKEGFTFECGPPAFGGFQLDGPAYRVMKEAAVEVRAERIDPAAEVIASGHRIKVYGDAEKLSFELWREFPDDIWRINKFLASLERMENDLWQASKPRPIPMPLNIRDGVRELIALNYRYLRIRPHFKRTLGEHLQRFVRNEGFRRLIDLLSLAFGQTTPEGCSLPYAANALMLGKRGFYYLHGGRRNLARRLIESLLRRKGEVRFNSKIERIILSGGRALGLRLEGGEVINARYIVAAESEWMGYLGKSMGRELSVGRPTPLRRRKGLALCLGVDNRAIQSGPQGQLILLEGSRSEPSQGAPLSIFIYPADDPTSAPDGRRMITVSWLSPPGSGLDESPGPVDYASEALNRLREVWPGIGERAVIVEPLNLDGLPAPSEPSGEAKALHDIGLTGHVGFLKKTPVNNLLALAGRVPFGWRGASAFASSLYLADFISRELRIK
jgi:phytoene dehydrogenase-like protein